MCGPHLVDAEAIEIDHVVECAVAASAAGPPAKPARPRVRRSRPGPSSHRDIAGQATARPGTDFFVPIRSRASKP